MGSNATVDASTSTSPRPTSAASSSAAPAATTPTATAPAGQDVTASAQPKPGSAAYIHAKLQARLRQYTWLAVTGRGSDKGVATTLVVRGSTVSDEPFQLIRQRGHSSLEIRRLNSLVYMKATKELYLSDVRDEGKTPTAREQAYFEYMDNRWMKGPPRSSHFSDDMTMKSMVDGMLDDGPDEGFSGSIVTKTSLNGRPAFQLLSLNGSSAIWVSSDGTYDLLKIKNFGPHTSPDEPDELTFSEWNQPKKIETPQGAIDNPE